MKELTCVVCPRGCRITVSDDLLEVSGNRCPRGKTYAIQEAKDPVRTVTSTVKLEGASVRRLPVRSSVPVRKELMFKIMDEIKKAEAAAPVNEGDVIINNILDTGADIIASKGFKKI